MSESFFKEVLPIIIWVLVMIVAGRIKKKRKQEQESTPAPAPQRRRSPARAPVPRPATSHPIPQVAQRTPPVGVPRTSAVAPPPPPPRIRWVIPTGVELLLDHLFRGTPWDKVLGRRMRSWAEDLRKPEQLLGWVDETAAAALSELGDLEQKIDEAVELSVGAGEFAVSTLEEFIKESPRLASTWSRDLFADAFGISLFGPGFIDLRESIERQRPDRDTIPLTASGNQGALRMPYSVRRSLLEDVVRRLDMEHGWRGPRGWDSPAAQVVFDMGGLQRIKVPTEPLTAASLEILQRILRMRLPSLDGRNIEELRGHHPWLTRLTGHVELARVIQTGASRIQLEDVDLLPAFIHLRLQDRTKDWEPLLLALAEETRQRGLRRRGKTRGVARGTRAAMIEGLLITEILGENLGRRTPRPGLGAAS